MSPTEKLSETIRYLAAKRAVDDRALNRHVMDALWDQIPARPLRIIEVGAGIGTMLERLLDSDLLTGGQYLAVDREPRLLSEGEQRLRRWASARGVAIRDTPSGLELDLHDGLLVSWQQADVTGPELDAVRGQWDLLLAHAFLDLVDLERTLPRLLRLLPAEGWFWFTINFDGVTRFLPVIDGELDRRIEKLYHLSMDERTDDMGRAAGHSRTGRLLLTQLLQAGCRLQAAGASDWVLHPTGSSYAEGSAALLSYLLDTVSAELEGHPELHPQEFSTWLEQRRTQLAQGELALLAHQLDMCGQRADAYSKPD